MNIIKTCCPCARSHNEPSAPTSPSTMAKICRTISCLWTCNVSVCPCSAETTKELISRVTTNYTQAEEGYLVEIPLQVRRYLTSRFISAIDPDSSLVKKWNDLKNQENGLLILDETERNILLTYCIELRDKESLFPLGFNAFVDQLLVARNQPFALLEKAPMPLTVAPDDDYEHRMCHRQYVQTIYASREEQKQIRTEDLHLPREHFFTLPAQIRVDEAICFFDGSVGYKAESGDVVLSLDERWKIGPDNKKMIYKIDEPQVLG